MSSTSYIAIDTLFEQYMATLQHITPETANERGQAECLPLAWRTSMKPGFSHNLLSVHAGAKNKPGQPLCCQIVTNTFKDLCEDHMLSGAYIDEGGEQFPPLKSIYLKNSFECTRVVSQNYLENSLECTRVVSQNQIGFSMIHMCMRNVGRTGQGNWFN